MNVERELSTVKTEVLYPYLPVIIVDLVGEQTGLAHTLLNSYLKNIRFKWNI